MENSREDVSILHISDIHFGMRDDNGHQARNADAVRTAISDLKGQVDCIVFTGDLAQSGLFSEFQQGQEWLTAISENLACPCILVPGNHDIVRRKADKKILRAAKQNEQEFGNWQPEILKSHPHIKPFIEWFSLCKQDHPVFLNNWKSNPAVDKVSVSLNGYPCIFICMNTALLSCDNDDETNLCVNIKAFNNSLAKLAADKNAILALGHHPVSALAPWNGEELNKLLGQSTGPHIYLHGHLHKTDIAAKYASTGAGYFSGAAGAIYPGSKYEKQFSIISLNFSKQSIASQVYSFNEDAGIWQVDNSKSHSMPARLPNLLRKEESSKDQGGHPPIMPHDTLKNPFAEYMANGISAESVHLLFVERRNSLQDLRTYHDNVIEGQRGTGKTMLLRYFSAEVQKSLLSGPDNTDSMISLLNRNRVPFGVYCCLTGAGLDRTDFSAISDSTRAKLLFSHLATLFIFGKLVSTLKGLTIERALNSIDINSDLRHLTTTLLRIAPSSVGSSTRSFLMYVSVSLEALRTEAYEHLASCLPGSIQTTFHPWLSLGATLLPLLEAYKEDLGLSEPFFLLVDDFDKLSSQQQSIFFSVAAARRHDVVCFKFGSMSEGVKTNTTIDGRRYSEGDDYDHIPLDWVDGGVDPEKNKPYKDSLEEITRRRLVRAGWPESLNLETLFDNWRSGSRIYDEAKTLAEVEFNSLAGPQRNQKFESFWNKQGTSRYFKLLALRKIPHRYAGSSTIIEVSSGIYRQFLEVCGRIMNTAITKGWRPGDGKVGSEIQNRCIRDWSSGMYRNLESSADATNLGNHSALITSEHLVNLANSLTQYFRWRLLSNSKDPEVIAIAIRDPIQFGSFTKSLLDVAVRETLLQRRALDYSNKGGDGRRLPTYQLNRRLVPHVGIGTKVQGRYEIDCATLELAAKDTEGFLRKMRGLPDHDQSDLGF